MLCQSDILKDLQISFKTNAKGEILMNCPFGMVGKSRDIFPGFILLTICLLSSSPLFSVFSGIGVRGYTSGTNGFCWVSFWGSPLVGGTTIVVLGSTLCCPIPATNLENMTIVVLVQPFVVLNPRRDSTELYLGLLSVPVLFDPIWPYCRPCAIMTSHRSLMSTPLSSAPTIYQ